MGGWMTYQRMRNRNGLRGDGYSTSLVVGDLDRMERDYLNPVYPEPPYATRPGRSDPLSEIADATGEDIEAVRKILRFVFTEQA